MENLFVKKMCKKYNRSEKFFELLLKICEDNNILNKERIIEQVCQKVCQNKQQPSQNVVK